MKRVSFIVMIALALVASPRAIAQQTTTQASQGSGQGSGQGQGRTTTSSNPLGPLAAAENIKLELVVSDQTGTAQPVKKVMTLLLAERATGRVRSGGEVYRAGTEQAPGSQYIPVTLNADVNVTAISGDRIRVGITVEYMPAITGPESAHRRTQLNQTVDVVLTNGKPTLIVESADPTSDRKVSLTATATIVR